MHFEIFDAPSAPTDERHIGKLVYALCRWILRMLTSCKIQCGFRYSALGGGSKFTGRGLHMFCPTVQYSCAPVCPVCVPAPCLFTGSRAAEP